MCHMPKHWDNAQDLDEFKPERWENFKPNPLTYLPFGFGRRLCPGKNIAMTNIATIITYLVQNYRIEETDTPAKLAMQIGVSIRSSDKLRFTPRH
eukprot:m.7993 g.7993  ORF g.7993 m.7993 type:complete len:95 (+) comp6396_c0_seq1:961-1245(+)